MKRSAGVTVIAVLALVGSAFTLLVGVGMLVAVAIVPAPESTEFPGSPMLFRIILVFASLMYLLPAAWGIFTGIGLLRLKNWARISTIVFSVLLILMGGFTALMSLIVPLPVTTHSDVDPAVMSGIRMASGAFWLTLLGIASGGLFTLTDQRSNTSLVTLRSWANPYRNLLHCRRHSNLMSRRRAIVL
jgi:hypothetical protein